MGCGATALFTLLRAINIYGDPSHWSRQSSLTFTVLSFLNTTKYPPSLLFLLMTLGPAMLALAWFEKDTGAPATLWRRLRNFFITFGRVPLFFYLLQWPTAHLISVVLHFASGKPWRWMFGSQLGVDSPPARHWFQPVGCLRLLDRGCAVAVSALQVVCRCKARRRDWWLSYL